MIPEPLLTWLVRWTMDDREVMAVLLYDETSWTGNLRPDSCNGLPNWSRSTPLLWIGDTGIVPRWSSSFLQPWEVLPVEAIFWRDQYALARRSARQAFSEQAHPCGGGGMGVGDACWCWCR